MKTLAALLAFPVLLGSIAFAQAHQQKEPVDYVSPNIGGIGHLLTATLPYVQRPHGMARPSRRLELATGISRTRYMVFPPVQRH
jgi:hypothetical protein